MATITLQGNEIHTSGSFPEIGSKAPDFTLTDGEMNDVSLGKWMGKKNEELAKDDMKFQTLAMMRVQLDAYVKIAGIHQKNEVKLRLEKMLDRIDQRITAENLPADFMDSFQGDKMYRNLVDILSKVLDMEQNPKKMMIKPGHKFTI